jgi:hypothetical protein
MSNTERKNRESYNAGDREKRYILGGESKGVKIERRIKKGIVKEELMYNSIIMERLMNEG